MLFDARCLGCGDRLPRGRRLFCGCAGLGEPPPDRFVDGLVVCGAFDYDGPGRTAVRALKYRGRRDVVPELVRRLLPRLSTFDIDAVTWMPGSRAGARERVVEPAPLLAHALARALGRPARHLLRRIDNRPQVGRLRRERLAGPELRPRGSDPSRVLLVDDVVTTGTSVARAIDTLRPVGVTVVAVAAAGLVPVESARGGRRDDATQRG